MEPPSPPPHTHTQTHTRTRPYNLAPTPTNTLTHTHNLPHPPLLTPTHPHSVHVTSGLEAQVERLVGASAAVEDALAGLAVDAAGAPPPLRRRAALTYVKRLYSPFLLREPLVQNIHAAHAHGAPGAAAAGGGDGETARLLQGLVQGLRGVCLSEGDCCVVSVAGLSR